MPPDWAIHGGFSDNFRSMFARKMRIFRAKYQARQVRLSEFFLGERPSPDEPDTRLARQCQRLIRPE
jgi:hypothetical protein